MWAKKVGIQFFFPRTMTFWLDDGQSSSKKSQIHLGQITLGLNFFWNQIPLGQITFGLNFFWNQIPLGQITFGLNFFWTQFCVGSIPPHFNINVNKKYMRMAGHSNGKDLLGQRSNFWGQASFGTNFSWVKFPFFGFNSPWGNLPWTKFYLGSITLGPFFVGQISVGQ